MADLFAISISGICALHCLLLPIVLIAFPLLGASFVSDERFHAWMLWALLPLATVAFYLGCRRHKDLVVLAMGAGGLAILAFAVLAGHDLLGETVERVIVLIGGATMIAGHWRNFRLCRHTACTHAPDSGQAQIREPSP